MLEARSVALVGASARPGSLGARMVAEVARSPSRPRTYLVNPRYADIDGVPCLPDLAAVPEPVDLALLAVPDSALEAQLGAAARARARSALIFGNAFDLPAARPGLRDRLAATARSAGMAVCGAGCMGFVNVARGLRAVGYIEPDLHPGPVALVTHSGSVFSALLRARRGFGFSLAVSSGQELVTTAADYARYALGLPETRVLALVLEAIRDAAALRSVLADALAADVPVALLSVGISAAGTALVSAHSGALAAADGAWEALAAAYGLHRVRDLAELADTLELFAVGQAAGVVPSGPRASRPCTTPAWNARTPPTWPPTSACRSPPSPPRHGPAGRGPRPGPGPGQPARRVGDRPRHRAAVRRVPVRAGRRPGGGRGRAGRRPGARVRRRRVLPAGGAHRGRGHAQAGGGAGRAARRRRPGRRGPAARGRRPGPRRHPHRAARPAPPARPPRAARAAAGPEPAGPAAGRWRAALARGGLDGAALFGLLRDYGIPAVRTRAAATRAAALAAADEIGYPVVLKTGEPGIAHKSDVGGVRLGLAGPAAAGAAYDDLAARLGPRVLVCETAAPGAELALGIIRDPAVGPLLVVGAGGIFVEIFSERAVLLAPVTHPAAMAAVGRLRLAPVLAGSRGQPAADLGAIADAITGLSRLACDLGDLLDALDINPLICGPSGAVAADALLVPRSPS